MLRIAGDLWAVPWQVAFELAGDLVAHLDCSDAQAIWAAAGRCGRIAHLEN